ncbi:centrosomal protein CCDC61-like isoform X2 [Leptopilina boulardi]|uniref:centrosomal protein CCDC61-like isoform X2 n=1 Tax=Leptopilina boulardi TaxID=63433 RepID=UPI0021F590CB|nr:centrosomal protein CCDC61-like isoform X2 [Leptopilina boulardi]
MNETAPNLVTTYSFKGGKEYVLKMRVTTLRGNSQRSLDLSVTDKYTGEDWHSAYDIAYIENLTHKTGNYKQFDIFVAMLQSGLLKTSESISLDLLTFEDLELLRSRRADNYSNPPVNHKNNNRRYLILTYTVEFDRIHYPLPLEYCGPPDPSILQATIRKLEAEIEKLNSTGVNKDLQTRVEQLTLANRKLIQDNQKLISGKGSRHLLNSVKSLERNVAEERASFRSQIQKLRAENASLNGKIRQLQQQQQQTTGNRKFPLSRNASPSFRKRCTTPPRSSQSYPNFRQQSRSQSPAFSNHAKTSSLSRSSSVESRKSKHSPRRITKKSNRLKTKEIYHKNR